MKIMYALTIVSRIMSRNTCKLCTKFIRLWRIVSKIHLMKNVYIEIKYYKCYDEIDER